MEERIVKGIWIPIEIWKDKNLTWNEKILLLEIDSYTSKDKDCYISNEFISELLGVNETNASKTISSLIKKGYVKKTRFDGRKRFVKAALSTATTLPCQEQQPSHAHAISGSNNINNIEGNKDTTNTVTKEKEYKEKFADFVKLYKKLTGRAVRGVDTEFNDFKKRHKDWMEVIPKLEQAIINETNARELARKQGKFFAEPKMLQTWLGKQRSWEMYSELDDEQEEQMTSQREEMLLQRFYGILGGQEADIYGMDRYSWTMLTPQQKNWHRKQPQNRSKMLAWIREHDG